MIKINKFIHIHFTTLILIIVCIYNKNINILTITYLSIIIHEFAHMIAAKLIGLGISHITLYPFGVNLQLKNTIIYSISDEIILYLSGPLINIVLALISIPFITIGNKWKIFYFNNLMLCLFNLLPIIPMDGGIILKKILMYKVGNNLSNKIMNLTSIVLIIGLVLSELVIIKFSSFNYTIIFICIFLIGNIFTNKEKYEIDYLKEILYYKKKNKFNIKKSKILLIKNNTDYKDIIKYFSQGNNYIIFKEDKDGKIKEILTEQEIIEELIK